MAFEAVNPTAEKEDDYSPQELMTPITRTTRVSDYESLIDDECLTLDGRHIHGSAKSENPNCGKLCCRKSPNTPILSSDNCSLSGDESTVELLSHVSVSPLLPPALHRTPFDANTVNDESADSNLIDTVDKANFHHVKMCDASRNDDYSSSQSSAFSSGESYSVNDGLGLKKFLLFVNNSTLSVSKVDTKRPLSKSKSSKAPQSQPSRILKFSPQSRKNKFFSPRSADTRRHDSFRRRKCGSSGRRADRRLSRKNVKVNLQK